MMFELQTVQKDKHQHVCLGFFLKQFSPFILCLILDINIQNMSEMFKRI